MAYSPIGQGRLPASPDLSAIAARHNATTFQVALAWVRISLIVGAHFARWWAPISPDRGRCGA